MAEEKADKMNALYDGFVDDLLAVLRSGKIRSQDRAVIRQFLKDHGMVTKMAKDPRIQAMLEEIPKFADEYDSLDDH